MTPIRLAKNIIKFIFRRNLEMRKNVFRKHYAKNVLLSYIVAPFRKVNMHRHTNFVECMTAAQIFDSLGYNVDVVNYNAKIKINFDKYDAIYGMGYNLERSFDSKRNIKRIVYGTGCNTIWSDIETLKRVRNFKITVGSKFLREKIEKKEGGGIYFLAADFLTFRATSSSCCPTI